MRLVELAVLYALIGAGGAVFAVTRLNAASTRSVDAVLMFTLWPLYGPFLLTREQATELEPPRGEVAFLSALRRVAGTPLATLLPDERTGRALARRLRVASDKVREIDGLLERPEFDESKALARVLELESDGSSAALGTARSRVQNIRRLRHLRDRFARELVEVEELLAQLTTQAEVVRLAGAPDSETRDLVQEILSRVEGLDSLLDDGPEEALTSNGRAKA
jgi:hypothetical protein